MQPNLNERLVDLACPSSKDFGTVLAQGADFNQPDESGDTPFTEIMSSICAGDILSECIRAGASINPITTRGTSPLIQAAMSQDYRIMAILLEEGADPNIVCFAEDDPQTALDIVYMEFHCTKRPADVKICEAMEMILREFGGKTCAELKKC